MKTVLLTSTEKGTGKTGIAVAVGRLAKEKGISVGYMKPKGTRLESNVGKTVDKDPMVAREVLGIEAEMHELEPIVYSPTFIDQAVRGREDPDELRDDVRSNFDALSDGRDLMVVEGGGTYVTGGIIDLTDIDVAELLDAEVVLVVDFDGMGDADEILAAADAVGDRFGGVIFNAVSDSDFDGVQSKLVPFLEGRGIPVIGVLPRRREISGVKVRDLADELNATVVTSPSDAESELVERFLVGAMSGESALRQFRRTKDAVVVTGGDRPEVQRAALESPGVRCLVLTGGLSPPGAVISMAEEKGVPVLVVDTDTLTTINELEEIIKAGQRPDEEMVETLAELLEQHADVDLLL